MAEVLTESFCERCGTRYTFESAKPRVKRLGGVKVLSRGLKNFVLSDDSSLDEAMAAARSDTEREVTAQQLDAFHKTFNFCMTCRQYTCANCWNEAEGACLTCSPHLGHEILPAPFPDLDPLGLTTLAAADAATTNGAANGANGLNGANSNGHAMPALDADAWPTMDAWPSHDLTNDADATPADQSAATMAPDEIDVEARMAALTAIGSGSTPTADPEAVAEAETEPEATVEAVAAPEAIEAESSLEADAAAEPEAAVEAAAEPEVAAVAEVAPETPPAAAPAQDRRLTTDEVAAVAAAQTTALIARFRPGQNLDAEIEAYEREQAAAQGPAPAGEPAVQAAVVADEPPAVAPEAVEPEPQVVAQTETVAESEPEPIAVAELIAAATVIAADPEPVASEPAPVTATEPESAVAEAAPEPEPKPVAAEVEPPAEAAPEPEPVAADRDAELAAAAAAAAVAAAVSKPTDVVPQPTWRIVAPDAEPTSAPVTPPAPSLPTAPPAAASATAPEWPANPEWPSQRPAAGLLLGRSVQPTGGLDSLWAESNREVASAAPVPGRPAPVAGVQPCVSCGLSLSATARFCRRCGTSQHA